MVSLLCSIAGSITGRGGWAGTEPEYLAAQVYFSQSPRPTAVVIGRQDLTASETVLAAVQACRAANTNWYALYVTGIAKADILSVAGYIETATRGSMEHYIVRAEPPGEERVEKEMVSFFTCLSSFWQIHNPMTLSSQKEN